MNLEEAKEFLYDELDFSNNRQVKYFPRENMKAQDIWNVIDNYFLSYDENVYLKLIEFIKENKSIMIKHK